MSWLGGERRASPHTIAAYGRDLAFFLDFLAAHIGGQPNLAMLSALKPADFRAFFAHRARDVERRSVGARAVGRAWVFPISRTPRSSVVPGARRPARAQAAARRPEGAVGGRCRGHHQDARRQRRRRLAGQARHRRADAALRLRVAHLGSAWAAARRRPARRADHDHRQGQQAAAGAGAAGGAPAVVDYLAACPYPLPPDGPLFVGARGGPLSPRIVQRQMETLRRALGLPETATPHALRHSFATHSLPAAAICARSRNYWATPACRRRSVISRSTVPACSMSTRRRTQGRAELFGPLASRPQCRPEAGGPRRLRSCSHPFRSRRSDMDCPPLYGERRFLDRLGQRGMGVTSASDVLGGSAEFDRQRRFRDHRPGVRSNDMDANHAVGRGVGQNFNKAFGVGIGPRPRVRREREFSDPVVDGGCLQLVLGFPDAGDFGPRIDDAGDRVVGDMRLLPGEALDARDPSSSALCASIGPRMTSPIA